MDERIMKVIKKDTLRGFNEYKQACSQTKQGNCI
jgi:hypothetical protein